MPQLSRKKHQLASQSTFAVSVVYLVCVNGTDDHDTMQEPVIPTVACASDLRNILAFTKRESEMQEQSSEQKDCLSSLQSEFLN